MPATLVETKKENAFQLDEFYLDLQEDGSTIRILPKEKVQAMPFPGLRPFKTSEFQLFNGRKGQARELIERLKQARFLAVIGSSGTGKTSLVRAGLIPELFGGSLREAGHRWNIAICRPGKNPIANLAIALSSVKVKSKDEGLLRKEYESLEATLNSSIYGLLEADEKIKAARPEAADNKLMVIVDQFEELFRYDRKDLGRQNIESHFVDLLLKAAAARGGSVYVIITMRSEFLGDCVRYRGLPEAINKGQYLVPGLKRNEVKDVVEGPIHLAGKEIEPGLVELLVNEIEDNKLKENLDQLPILQHALMRTYQRAGDSPIITYEHYKAVGQMQEALARHAREKFSELADAATPDVYSQKQKIAKIAFQALTDASTDLKGGRRPTALKNIYAIAAAIGAGKAEVNEVVNTFRDSETSFIMPPANVALHEDLIMDISHESLMRNWGELKDWVKEEVRNGVLYQRLNARREEEGQVIQGTLLADLLAWRNQCPHNSAWAGRYHYFAEGKPDEATYKSLYDQNIAFLRKSEEAVAAAAEAEKTRITEEAKRQRDEEHRLEKVRYEEQAKSRWTLLRAFGLALLLAFGLVAWALVEKSKAKKAQGNAEWSEAKAKRNAADAEARRQEADSLTKMVQASYAHLEEQKRESDSLKNRAVKLADENLQQALAMQAAFEKADKALKDRDRFKTQFEVQNVMGFVRSQPFFQSPYIAEADKDSMAQAVFAAYGQQKDNDPAQYQDFIRHYVNVLLLQNINLADSARKLFVYDPVTGLRQARMAHWEDKWVEKIVNGIFRQKIFPSQTVNPLLFETKPDGQPYLLDTKFNSSLLLANSNQIVTGKLLGDSLALTDVAWMKPVADKDSLGYGYQWNNAMAVKDDGRILLLKNDSVLTEQQGGQTNVLDTLHGNSGWTLLQFSPDGKYLLTVKDTALLRWNLASAGAGTHLTADTLRTDPRYKNISNVFFSPDGQTLVLAFSNKRFEFWDWAAKQRLSRFGSAVYGWPAAFSPDGRFFLAQYSSRYIDVYDTVGNRVGSFSLPTTARERSGTADVAKQIAMAPDSKSLLVNYGHSLVTFSNPNGNSLMNAKGAPAAITGGDTLYAFNENLVDARYLNNGTVASLGEAGKLYVWKIADRFTSLLNAFRRVRPYTNATYAEKDEADPQAFERLMAEADVRRLRDAGTHYFENAVIGNGELAENISKAKRIFSELERRDDGFFKRLDSAKLVALLEMEAGSKVTDSMDRVRSTERYVNNVAAAKETVGQELEKWRADTANVELRKALAGDYWNLSFYQLFVGEYDSSIHYARQCLQLDPKQDGVITNLALAYLLKKDFAAAEKLYGQYAGKVFSDGTKRKFSESFLQDFDELVNAGIISTADGAVYEKMEEIKSKFLKPAKASKQ